MNPTRVLTLALLTALLMPLQPASAQRLNPNPGTPGDDDPGQGEVEKPHEEAEQDEPVNEDGSIGAGPDFIPASRHRESGPGNSESYKIEEGPCRDCGVTCPRITQSEESPSEYSDYDYFDPDEAGPGEEPDMGSFSKTFYLYGPGNLAIGSVRYFTHEFANPGRIALTTSLPKNFTTDTTLLPHPESATFTYNRLNFIKFGATNDPNAGRIEFIDAPATLLAKDPNAFIAVEKNFANQEIRRTTISFVTENGTKYFRMDVEEHGTITRHQQTNPALNQLVLEVGRLNGETFIPLRRTTHTKNFDNPNLRKERITIEERASASHPFVTISDRELWREAVMKPDSAKVLGLKGGLDTGSKSGSATKPATTLTKPTPEVGSPKRYVQDSTGKFYLRNTPHHYWRVVREIIDPDGTAPLVNTWEFYRPTDTAQPGFTPYAIGRIKSYQRHDGRQATFTYSLNQDTVTRPYAGDPQGMVTTAKWNPGIRTRTLTRTVQGQEISRVVMKYTDTRLTHTRYTSATGTLTTVIDYKPDGQLFGGFPTRALHADGTLTTYGYTRGTTGGIIITTDTGSTTDDTTVKDGLRTIEATNSRGHTIFRETRAIGHDAADGKIYDRMAVTQIDTRGRAEVTLWHPATASYEGEISVATGEKWRTSTEQFCCGPYSVTDQYGITTTYAYDGLKRRIKSNRLGVTTETRHLGLTTETHRYPEIVDANNSLLPALTTSGTTLISRTSRNLTGTLMVSESPNPAAFDQDGNGIPGELAATTTEITYQPAAGLSRRTVTTTPDEFEQTTDTFLDGRTYKTSGDLSPAMEYEYSVNPTGEITSASFLNTENLKLETSTTQTDWAGRTVQTAKGPIVTQYTYFPSNAPRGSRGQLASITDADGVTTRYAYNAKGDRTTTANKLDNLATAITYGTDRVTSSETIPALRGTSPVWRTTRKVWKDGDTNAEGGTVVSITDQSPDGLLSWTWTLGTGPAFDDPGAIFATALTTLQGSGNWTSLQTNPDGTKQIQIHTAGRLVRVEQRSAGSPGTVIAYTEYGYEEQDNNGFPGIPGRLRTTTDSRTGTTVTTYRSTTSDAVASITEPGNRTTAFKYDIRGRRTHVDAPNSVDAVNNVLANITITSYNPDGTIAQVSGGQTYHTTHTYDHARRMKTMTTYGTETATTTWIYHPTTGHLVEKNYHGETDNGATDRDYEYTAAGRLLTRTWERGVTTTYGYDIGGRHTSTNYSDSTPDVTITYDALSRPLTVSNGISNSSYQYDATTLALDTETITTSGLTRVLDRKRDNLGRNQGWELKNGTTIENQVTYDYSPTHGRLFEISNPQISNTPFTYSYTPNSNLLATITAPHHTVTNEWEEDRNVLASKENKVGPDLVSGYSYSVNSIGQRTKLTTDGSAFGDANRGWDWGYDSLGQVTTATHAADTTLNRAYEFDAIGNRLSSEISNTQISNPAGPNTTTYTPNAHNQYSAIENPQSTIFNPTHDADGNQLNSQILPLGSSSLESCVFTWDAENRLIEVRDANQTTLVTYTYDAYSRRVTTATTITFYDAWNPIAEWSADLQSATLSKTYTWGLDFSGSLQSAGGVGGLLAVHNHQGGTGHTGTFYPLFDGNGNGTQYIRNHHPTQSGVTVTSIEYDPFGRIIALTEDLPGVATQLPHKFSTKPQDTTTGLLYYGYRWYDPVTGRWPSRDPIEEEGGINLYGFVGNDGTNFWDHLGMYPHSQQDGMIIGDYDNKDYIVICQSSSGNGRVFYVGGEGSNVPTHAIDEKALEIAFSSPEGMAEVFTELIEMAANSWSDDAFARGITLKCCAAYRMEDAWSILVINAMFSEMGRLRSAGTGGARHPYIRPPSDRYETVRFPQSPSAVKGGPKPSPNFKPPTNPPQMPPSNLPPGYRVLRQQPTQQYPNGNWKILKDMGPGSKGQRINPSTMKPGPHPDTHVEFPPGYTGPYDY